MDIKNSLDLYRALTDANALVAVDKARAGQNARMSTRIPKDANAHQLRLMLVEACYTGLMHDFGRAAKDFKSVYTAEALADAIAPVVGLMQEEELWQLLEYLELEKLFIKDYVESEPSEEEEDDSDEPTEEGEILDESPGAEILDFPSAAKNG